MEHHDKKNITKNTIRIDAFSDGVFGIAITLLVLELIQALHNQNSGEKLQKIFLDHWQYFVAYTIGFITILVCWINHHVAFEFINKTNTTLMWINGFLLFVVTITPFSTAILAEYLEKESKTALAIFGFNYFLVSVAADGICTYAYKKHFIEEAQREYYLIYKKFYRYAIFYTLVAFLLSFVSTFVPTIMYVVLFVFFSAPKYFSSKFYKLKVVRKK
jgi:uncharacterized membrane protein